jgi:hypothetical protein
MSKFLGRRRNDSIGPISLIVPTASVINAAVGQLSTDREKSTPAAGRNFVGHLKTAVVDGGATLAQIVLPNQFDLPEPTGYPAAVERWHEFECEGADHLVQTGTGAIAADQAVFTRLAHVAGKLRVAQAGDEATHELIENLDPESGEAGDRRIVVRELAPHVVVA